MPLSAATSLDLFHGEAIGVTEVNGTLPPALELKQKLPKRNRCTLCRKKVGLTGELLAWRLGEGQDGAV